MKENNSNLEKSLSPINVLSLALGSIIGWGAFIMPGTTFLPGSGPLGTAIGMGIAVIIMCILGVNYGYMINKYPVVGGGFIFARKTMGKTHGYICGWFLSLAYLAIVPLNATAFPLVCRKLFGDTFQVGFLYNIAGYDIFVGEIVLAYIVLIAFGIASIKGISVAGSIQTIMAFLLVGAVVVLLASTGFVEEASVSNLAPAIPENVSLFAAVGAVIAVSPWAFIGFDTIPQAAEEFNFSHKKATSLMFISIIIAAFIYIAMTIITAVVEPWNSLLAKNYDWATGEAVEILLGRFGIVFLSIAIMCAIFSGILGFFMATSRLMMSMARAEALPAWFGMIDEKKKTPKNAIIFTMVIAAIAPWFGREALGWIVDMSSIGAAIGFFYTSLAALLEYRKSGEKNVIIILTSILGCVFGLMFVSFLVVPGMPGYLGIESRICLIVWIVLGIIFKIIQNMNKL